MDGGHLDKAGLGHLVEVVDASCGCLSDTLEIGELLEELFLHQVLRGEDAA